MRLLPKKTDFEAMTTPQLSEWAEAHPKDKRLILVLRILTKRSEETRKNIDWAIHELGKRMQAYLDSMGIDIPDDDEVNDDDEENNDLPILLDENVGEQSCN